MGYSISPTKLNANKCEKFIFFNFRVFFFYFFLHSLQVSFVCCYMCTRAQLSVLIILRVVCNLSVTMYYFFCINTGQAMSIHILVYEFVAGKHWIYQKNHLCRCIFNGIRTCSFFIRIYIYIDLELTTM